MRSFVSKTVVRAAAALTLAALTLPNARARAGGVRFGAPVKVTPNLGFGYEPGVVVDPYGNIFATAHKENWQLVVGPDPNAPTFTRSMSWDWVSVDGCKTSADIPGLPPDSDVQADTAYDGYLAGD